MALKFALAASVALATLLAASGAVMAQDDVSVRRIEVTKKFPTLVVDPQDTTEIAEAGEPIRLDTPVDPEDTADVSEEDILVLEDAVDPQDTVTAEETETVRPAKKQRVAKTEKFDVIDEEVEIIRPSKKQRLVDEERDEIRIVRPSELSDVEKVDLIESDEPVKRKKVVEVEDDYEDVEVRWAKTTSYDDENEYEPRKSRYSDYKQYESKKSHRLSYEEDTEDYAEDCEDGGYSY